MGHDDYPKTMQIAVDVMRHIKNERNNIVRKNKYYDQKHISNQENDNKRNKSSFAKTSKRRCFCCGYKDHFMDTCPKKDDNAKISGSKGPIKRSHTYRGLMMRTILLIMMC